MSPKLLIILIVLAGIAAVILAARSGGPRVTIIKDEKPKDDGDA